MVQKLYEYNEKRNFDKTTEPEGTETESHEGLKFVVQHHFAKRDHYDFRLEWKGILLSWAVPKGPSYDTRNKRLAIKVENHPLEYRNFEGTIPKGEYGGGTVMIWDEGYWEPYINVEQGLIEGMVKFVLKGIRLKGKWALVRLKNKEEKAGDNWLLLKEKDEYATFDDIIGQCTTSIRTGRTMSEIEGGENEKINRNPFQSADVQLAKLVKCVPKDDDWLYELKYDGYRILAFIECNNCRLVTRNGNDYARRFYDITSRICQWSQGRALVLDGEMVITDKSGKTDFQALQNYLKNQKAQSLTYIIFDILALDGVDLRNETLLKRKEALESIMEDAPKNLYYGRYVKGRGDESLAVSCEAGMEGIVGKKAYSVYSGTRNGDWIKIKCDKRQEFVIGGYTVSHKKCKGISSLLLGVYEGENLIYAGRAGTGISKDDSEIMEDKFKSIICPYSPFKVAPIQRTNEKILWLKPALAAEIKFAEWTKDNVLRQASFKGLRTDKNTIDIRRENAMENLQVKPDTAKEDIITAINSDAPTIEGIKITNPHKEIFEEPKITKGDVIRYYQRVSRLMMPYVCRRILSIVRCPKGVTQSCFYKKHPGTGSKGIITMTVPMNNDESEEYFYIEDISGLIYEAQMGTLEFHTWGSSIDNIEKPDMMVFDLDPDEGMDLNIIRRGVRDVKSILDELSLKSYLKTSGGKGYHVVVPLEPVAEWDIFHGFAKNVALVMEQKWPQRYTSNVRKTKRTDKIFIDWIRNARGATSIAPYSLRARNGAKVSMPIAWGELDDIAPDGININDALLRIEGSDPWADFFDTNQRLR